MGFLGIGLPGEGQARKAQKAMTQLAKSYQRTYDQYMPGALSALWRQYQNPYTSYDAAQMNTLQANSLRDYQQADTQLQQALASRGIGKSSYTGNYLANLWNAYGQALANARQQQMGQLMQRRQAALESLMGYASNAGNNAMNSYQNLYNLAQQQTQNALSGLGGLVSAGTYLASGGLSGLFGGGKTPPIVNAMPNMSTGTINYGGVGSAGYDPLRHSDLYSLRGLLGG